MAVPPVVYKGARPPPPKRKVEEPATTTKKNDDADVANGTEEQQQQQQTSTTAFALPTEDLGIDFSMRMWTKEGERVSASRPARVQYDPETGPRIRHRSDGAKGDFNVWWGKHATTTGGMARDFNSAVKAVTRCAPILDAGATKANGSGVTAVCYHFARGCCGSGEACEYLHKVPTAFDDAKNHMMYDIFGRPKHHTERDDNGGTGSYMRIGRTLYLYFGGAVDPNWDAKKVYDEIAAQFGEFGPIEDVTVKFDRRFAFVRYKFRASAEFAKEAMAGQTLWRAEEAEPLNVRWANDDPNPIAIVRVANETEERVRDMFLRSEKAQALMQMKRELEGGGVGDGDGDEDDGSAKRKSKKKPKRRRDGEDEAPPDCSFDPADYEEEKDEV